MIDVERLDSVDLIMKRRAVYKAAQMRLKFCVYMKHTDFIRANASLKMHNTQCVCVCVCVCVCERERESVCVCVCVCV